MQMPLDTVDKRIRWIEAGKSLGQVYGAGLGCELAHYRENRCAEVWELAGNFWFHVTSLCHLGYS
jgi:hypothetical protein